MSLFGVDPRLYESLKELTEDLREQIAWLRKREEGLVATLVSMRRDGFQPSIAPPAERSSAPSLDPRISAAIAKVCPSGPSGRTLEREMTSWAEAQLLMGKEVEDVVDEILTGGDVG